MTARGGDQEIPRPPGTTAGAPAPWLELSTDERRIGLSALEARLVAAGPARTIDTPMPATTTSRSGVLAALYEGDEGATVVLTRRAGHLRNHRGEVSFPGGREEPHDADLWATALREAHEEVALDPAAVRRVGELDRLRTFTSRAEIHPFVGHLDEPPQDLVAEPGEVDTILHVPLVELTHPDVYREEQWEFPTGRQRPMYFFELVGDTVWGATARMLRQLLTIGLELPDDTGA